MRSIGLQRLILRRRSSSCSSDWSAAALRGNRPLRPRVIRVISRDGVTPSMWSSVTWLVGFCPRASSLADMLLVWPPGPMEPSTDGPLQTQRIDTDRRGSGKPRLT